MEDVLIPLLGTISMFLVLHLIGWLKPILSFIIGVVIFLGAIGTMMIICFPVPIMILYKGSPEAKNLTILVLICAVLTFIIGQVKED